MNRAGSHHRKGHVLSDNVNHPAHYAEGWSNGAEVIDITENLNFNRGNAIKYIARAGKKNPDSEVEDLEKAQWYLSRELERLNKMLKPKSAWTLGDLEELRRQFWGQREPHWEITVHPRQWDRLIYVPPNIIVEDRDGDYYRRISGTSKFAYSFREETHGQHYEWQDMTNGMYRDVDDYGPFKEVING